jgi:hypothetical protein
MKSLEYSLKPNLVPKLLLGNSYVSSCLGGIALGMHSQSGDWERVKHILKHL